MNRLERDGLRYELKYIIRKDDHHRLRSLLGRILRPDPYGNENGAYHVRSLYFDDLFNSAYREKNAGIEKRHKYRIRIYNYSSSVIRFEKKIKINERVCKQSARMSREEYDVLIDNRSVFVADLNGGLLDEVYIGTRTKRLRPVIIVDYMREAYVHHLEDVRITFDSDLRVCGARFDLFGRRLPTLPVMDAPFLVLEVKFNHRLPSFLGNVFDELNANRESVSKYVLCRDMHRFAEGVQAC